VRRARTTWPYVWGISSARARPVWSRVSTRSARKIGFTDARGLSTRATGESLGARGGIFAGEVRACRARGRPLSARGAPWCCARPIGRARRRGPTNVALGPREEECRGRAFQPGARRIRFTDARDHWTGAAGGVVAARCPMSFVDDLDPLRRPPRSPVAELDPPVDELDPPFVTSPPSMSSIPPSMTSIPGFDDHDPALRRPRSRASTSIRASSLRTGPGPPRYRAWSGRHRAG
jgi:hypothetical protein